ncbi:MAG TPA: GWxTD domain-containing protein [Gemmatimonadales bacterium]|nr:GWxTD domain-containing protein [Gemmatimonadales bacterium]
MTYPRAVVSLALFGTALFGTACGSWQRVGSSPAPSTEQTLTQILDLATTYRRLGRLAAEEPVPFVGTVVFAAAPNDSVLGVLGLSLPNRALVFQREERGFVARYRVEATFLRAGAAPIRLARDEVVRVASFQETTRSDESIVFQEAVRLEPGTYRVSVVVRDRTNNESSRAEAEYIAPRLGEGSVSEPMLVYQARSRRRLTDTLSFILNPRGTVAYGGDTLSAYVEGYRFAGPATVPVEIRDGQDSVVLRDSIRFDGGSEVEGRILRLLPDTMPLGELVVAVGRGDDRRQQTALVSFSHAWLVTNFEEMISLLRYFGQDNRLAAIRRASPAERPALWREFWRDTDPDPSTPENEAIAQYFARVAIANQRFNDEGIEGWRTDRGEVYITLGDPDETFDASATSQGRVIRWSYTNERLTLFFHDETGFGRFRLTPNSRSEFERVVGRLRRQAS